MKIRLINYQYEIILSFVHIYKYYFSLETIKIIFLYNYKFLYEGIQMIGPNNWGLIKLIDRLIDKFLNKHI
jgi:hypothetical protein